MKIDRNNYEVFVIDYFDGKLDAETTSALMSFLENNPDLKEEFEIFTQPLPKPDAIIFEKKETLKKQTVKAIAEINEDNYEDYFIAFYEGDLNSQENADLKNFLESNEFLHNEFQLFGKLKLQADDSVIYTGKKSLKKQSNLRIVYYVVSVAAAVLLFFSIYPFYKTEIQTTPVITKAELSSMRKIDLAIKINHQIEANIILSDKNKVSIRFEENLAENNTAEDISEKIEIVSLEVRNLQVDQISAADFTLLEENKPQEMAFEDSPKEKIPEKEKKSALGRVLDKNVGGLLAVFKREKKNLVVKDEPGFVKFLDQSLLVFNTITGSDAELTKVYNQDGKLSSYGFEAGAVNITRNLSKAKE